MAIDTTEKKLSLIQPMIPWTGVLPYSDGSLDQGDKQHLLRGYSGILWGEPAAPTVMPLERASMRRIFGRVFGRVN